MTATKKPKPPTFGSYKASHGADWKAELKAGKMTQKAANAALHKAKKGTPEYAAAKAAFDAAYMAIPHAEHKASGFSKLVSKVAGITIPVLPTTHGIQLTAGAKGILGSKVSALTDKALQVGGGLALAGAAADVASGFMGSGGTIGQTGEIGPQLMDESSGGNFIDDVFAGLNKAGQYASQGQAVLAQFQDQFGGGSSSSTGGASGSDMGPSSSAPSTWSKYGLWIAAGAGLLLVLVLVLRKR